MGKTSDWALEVEEQEQIMQELTATHAETVEKVEKPIFIASSLAFST